MKHKKVIKWTGGMVLLFLVFTGCQSNNDNQKTVNTEVKTNWHNQTKRITIDTILIIKTIKICQYQIQQHCITQVF